MDEALYFLDLENICMGEMQRTFMEALDFENFKKNLDLENFEFSKLRKFHEKSELIKFFNLVWTQIFLMSELRNFWLGLDLVTNEVWTLNF